MFRAAINDAGRFYLEHNQHPDDPRFKTDGPGRQGDDVGTLPAKNGGQTTKARTAKVRTRRPPPARTAEITADRRKAAEELLAELVDRGETVIQTTTDEDRAYWRKVVDFAKRNGLVPDGKRIEKWQRFDAELHIKLVSGLHPNAKPTGSRIPVPIPESSQLHPLLMPDTRPKNSLYVSEASEPRALRILHALIVEAERRSCVVDWPQQPERGLEIKMDGYSQIISLEEETEVKDVLPTPEDLAEQTTYAWQRVQPELRELRTGRLALTLAEPGKYGKRRRWADRKRWSLEDKLGELLATFEANVQEQRDRQAAAEEERLRRERNWEAAIARARERFHRERRIAALTEQVDSWKRAAEIRAYCDALDAAGLSEKEWVEWARSYADEIDPGLHAAKAPETAEPTNEDLRKYLGRRSPYGPNSTY